MTTTLRTALEQLTPPDEGGLEAFVRSRRDRGSSWRRISVELYDVTGVAVAHESLRAWFPDEPAEAVG